MRHLLALALIVALGLVGTADLEDAQRDEALYCKFVADGTWPAYNSEINCNKQQYSVVRCGLIAALDKLTRKEKEMTDFDWSGYELEQDEIEEQTNPKLNDDEGFIEVKKSGKNN